MTAPGQPPEPGPAEKERRLREAAGRIRALDFAWPRVVDRIEAVYRNAVGQRRAAQAGHSAA